MNYILQLSNKDVKAAIMKILHQLQILMKKTNKIGNPSQELEVIKSNQLEIIELKTLIRKKT